MSEAQNSAEDEKRITAPLAQEIAVRFEVLAVKSESASDYHGVVFGGGDVIAGGVELAARWTIIASDPTVGLIRIAAPLKAFLLRSIA